MTLTTLTLSTLEWINIPHPLPEDMQALAARFPTFHPLNLQDCLTDLEIPKINHTDGYLFLVVQMPFWDPTLRISRPAEIDIFVTQKTLITSHRGELKALTELFTQAKDQPNALQTWEQYGSAGLLYVLMNHLVDACFPMVRKIAGKLRAAEEQLFSEKTRDLLNQVMVLRRDIITMRAILDAQAEIVADLLHTQWSLIPDALNPYWSDLNDHLRQLVSALNQYTEMVSGLSDSIDTLASHRIDEVVRLLTVATVLTLPITLLTTFLA